MTMLELARQVAARDYPGRTIFFIDDTKANINAALKNNVYGIHLMQGNFEAVESEFKKIGLLPHIA